MIVSDAPNCGIYDHTSFIVQATGQTHVVYPDNACHGSSKFNVNGQAWDKPSNSTLCGAPSG